MSKYDFEIDLSQNSSTGVILGKIEKGSVVLEFGCAAGRMTRYMKENLDCRVYIVEYDRQAYESALEFAQGGLCDDIMNFRWTEKFRGIAFDAILFVDVLEHLSAPEKVLEQAAALLKDTGSVYVSLPNITHNDILLKAYEEHFDYTATGLLDDTHVHFWGLNNIRALSEKSGLNLRSVEGTFCPVGGTEQQVQAGKHVLLENILKERQCGEVYQFVVTLDKQDKPEESFRYRVPAIRSHIYLDTGKDFNPEQIIAFDSQYSGQGSYIAHHVIENPGNIRRIKFDPIEDQGCILRRISIRQGEKSLPVTTPKGKAIPEGLWLPGDDPMVCANVPFPDGLIFVDAEIVLPGENYIKMLESAYWSKCVEVEKLSAETVCLTPEEKTLRHAVSELTGEKQILQQDVGAYVTLVTKKEMSILALEQETAAQKRDISVLEQETAAQKQHISVLEQETAAQKQNIAVLEHRVNEYMVLVEQKNENIQTLEQAVSYYQNLKVVKLRAFISRILRGIKRRIRRVTGKEE